MNTNTLLKKAVLSLLVLVATGSRGTSQVQTPLTQAVLKDDVRQAKQLLAQGEEINRTNGLGWTPLMLAAGRRSKDMVVLLLAEGADANYQGFFGISPLYWAAARSDPPILDALIKAKANVEIKAGNNLTPIMVAAVEGKLENVQILQNAKAKFTNDLVYSSALGQLDLVKGFLAKGVNVNASNETGRTPLVVAAANGHLAVVNLLLEHDADVNLEGKDSDLTRSALIYAAQKGHLEIVKALLDKKASLKPDSSAQTALFTAVDGGHLDVIKYLLGHGADPNGRNPNGDPVLFTAAQKEASAVKVLLDGGADINATNKFGSTPLIIASYYGNADSVLALLSKGARTSAKTTQGLTALQIAKNLRDREHIIEILSDPDAASKNLANFKTSTANFPIDSKTVTRAEWREKVRPYWNPGGPMKITTVAVFKRMFGEPTQTQTDGDSGHAYWFYECSDGSIKIDLVDPNMTSGTLAISSMSDF